MMQKKCLIAMVLLMTVCLVLSCTTNRKTTVPRSSRLVYGVVLAKGILEKNGIGEPQYPTNTFATKDKQVVAIIRMNNLAGQNKLRWDWHAPSGELYMSSNDFPLDSVSSGKCLRSMTAWHAMRIYGDMAEKLTGQWRVYIYFNDELIEHKMFTLVSSKK